MTKSFDVPIAVKAMLVNALPNAEVLGLDGEEALPDRVGPNGRCTIEFGNPGRPEIDLSPVMYNYQHQIPVTLDAVASADQTAAQIIAGMLDLISAAIEGDRFLGGAVDYLDATAPPTDDEYIEGAPVMSSAAVTIVATYSTAHPL